MYLSLGIPSVTFISPRPAKWKVLSVICVDGSPMDYNKKEFYWEREAGYHSSMEYAKTD